MRLPHLELPPVEEAAGRGVALVGSAVGAVAGTVMQGRETLRRLPTTAAQLPVLALNSALISAERLRGEAQHAGGAVALVKAKAERLPQSMQGALMLAKFAVEQARNGLLHSRPEDAPVVVGHDTQVTEPVTPPAAEPVVHSPVPRTVADTPEPAVEVAAAPAPEHAPEHIDSATSAEVADTVAEVSALSGSHEGVAAADLPLAGYDGMTLASLRGRLRTLTTDDLLTLRAYEAAHAHRIQVVTMLDNRIAKISQG